MLNGIKKPKY